VASFTPIWRTVFRLTSKDSSSCVHSPPCRWRCSRSAPALSVDSIKDHFKLSLIALGFKLVVLPVVDYLFLTIFDVAGIALKVRLIYFALPTPTSLYILSAQLNSDTKLASAAIALSTILSFFSLSAALMINPP
jgi:predicted permease